MHSPPLEVKRRENKGKDHSQTAGLFFCQLVYVYTRFVFSKHSSGLVWTKEDTFSLMCKAGFACMYVHPIYLFQVPMQARRRTGVEIVVHYHVSARY